MRFLADAGISPRTVEFLRSSGHDAVHVRERGMQSSPDTDILALCRREEWVLLTFDLDFGDLLALGVLAKPSALIFRLADETASAVNARIEAVLSERATELESGTLILVEETRYRVRTLPIGGR
jgi:predicted nuclease of predicted toxin-antitoxin system